VSELYIPAQYFVSPITAFTCYSMLSPLKYPPRNLIQLFQWLYQCWKHFQTSSIQQSTSVASDLCWIAVMSRNSLPFEANFTCSPKTSHGVLGTRSSVLAGPQSGHYWAKNCCTKLSEQGDFLCAQTDYITAQVCFRIHLQDFCNTAQASTDGT